MKTATVRCSLALTLLLAFAGRLTAQDDDAQLLLEAQRASDAGQSARAVELLDQFLKRRPEAAAAWYLRGREHFRLGQVEKSVADFDHYVKLRPQAESRQWERGIADYYAGQFAKGARQFALYQTYHDNDVENAVWRYLCMVAAADDRQQGLVEARAKLLPIENDRRVPMMQIYALYRGKLSPAEVLEAAEEGNLTAEERNRQLFYAHLYLGLYYAAEGKAELERKHILAAEQHKIGHYMWDVAHVHAERLRGRDE